MLCFVYFIEKSVENKRSMQQQYKESCYLCKEMKRRNLAVYIKSKSRNDSCHGIHEEEEEIDAMPVEKKNINVNQEKCVTSSHNIDERKLGFFHTMDNNDNINFKKHNIHTDANTGI